MQQKVLGIGPSKMQIWLIPTIAFLLYFLRFTDKLKILKFLSSFYYHVFPQSKYFWICHSAASPVGLDPKKLIAIFLSSYDEFTLIKSVQECSTPIVSSLLSGYLGCCCNCPRATSLLLPSH